MYPEFQGKVKRWRQRRSAIRGYQLQGNVPDMMLSETTRIKREIPDFDPDLEFEYSPRALMLLTEKILLCDEKPPTEEPMWLNTPMYIDRAKREIFTTEGVPDPGIVSGMYWRTHPRGRKVNTDEARKERGASYYK